MSPRAVLPEAFYARPPDELAPLLLNTILVGPAGAGRIVEVEAYDGANDPASHAYRGPSPRTRSMFGPPGRLYVYRSYGMHWCANIVCRYDGVAAAVLVRALEPLDGLEAMQGNRPGITRTRDLANGPGKLCAALGVTGVHDGVALFSLQSPVRVETDATPPPQAPVQTTRVGISRAVEHPWRWYVAASPYVSRR